MENNNQLESESLYDMNKRLMANVQVLDPIMVNRECEYVARKMLNHEYYMLLCRERNDYTIFTISGKRDADTIAKDIYEVLFNRGLLVAVDKILNSDNFEIWVRDHQTDENFLYMLFECKDFIVEV